MKDNRTIEQMWREMTAPQPVEEALNMQVKRAADQLKKLVDKEKNVQKKMKMADEIMQTILGEEHGAGEWGTDKLRKTYAKDTPGQMPNAELAVDGVPSVGGQIAKPDPFKGASAVQKPKGVSLAEGPDDEGDSDMIEESSDHPAAKALTDYANSKKAGIDKEYFHTAARHIAAGRHKELANHVRNGDTDPRDHVLDTIHKHDKDLSDKIHKAAGFKRLREQQETSPMEFMEMTRDERLAAIKAAHQRVMQKEKEAEARAKRDAKRGMKSPGATKGMADVKMEDTQLDEISPKLARKAAAASGAKHYEYSSSAYGPGADKESDRLEKKADKARAHVQKRQGDKGSDKVDRLTNKLVFGRSRMESVEEAKKLDPVGKADADIDNDGDVDKSDSYLHNRRKAIKKAINKEESYRGKGGGYHYPDAVKKGEKLKPKYTPAQIQKMDKAALKAAQNEGMMDAVKAKIGKLKKSVSDFHKTDVAAQIRKNKTTKTMESYSDKEIRMAKGIAFDPRHKGGDYSGAAKKMEKIKKGLSDHPKVKDALRRANESVQVEEKTPTGVKIYHKDKKTGKESWSIHFTARDAQRHVDQMKKAGHTETKRALMYGDKEGKPRIMSK